MLSPSTPPPPSTPVPERITFAPVAAGDFDELLAIRIAAMRESLERVGRFDPQRARERLQRSFYPAASEFILLDGERLGFYTLRAAPNGLHLEHLYLLPRAQSAGVGSYVLRRLLNRADAARQPVMLGALRESPANRFYQRHGFVQTDSSEWDFYYTRQPTPLADGAPTAAPER